jgi:hypothetical protein
VVSEDAGFWDTLWALVPLGLAGAFSWLPLTGLVLLLLAGSGMARVWAFVAGRVFGLALITVAFVAGARALPVPRSAPSLEGPVVAGAEVTVGVALVAVGLVAWLRRNRERSEPAWRRRLSEASVPAVFLTSVVVDLQPKGLVLGLASGVVVRAGSMPVAEAVLAVVLYLAVAASSVLLPLVATYAAPAGTRRWLRAAQSWLDDYGSFLTAVVAALVGVVLVVDGLGRF